MNYNVLAFQFQPTRVLDVIVLVPKTCDNEPWSTILIPTRKVSPTTERLFSLFTLLLKQSYNLTQGRGI